MKRNPYMPIPAEIEDIKEETPSIKTFVLRPAEAISFRSGQFVELTVPGVGEAPFTPSSSPRVSERLEITIMRVGRVTEALHAMAPGAKLGIRGPLGRAYPIEEFYGREVLIAGGGCGVGPLRALVYDLLEESDKYRKIILRYGARSPSDIVFKEAVEHGWEQNDAIDIRMTVDHADKTWKGHVGVLPTILTEQFTPCEPASGVAVMCGPPLMMRFTTMKLLERGYPPSSIYLSLEKNMSCGVGHCGHCRLGPYYCCHDGPVFSYEELESVPRLWEE